MLTCKEASLLASKKLDKRLTLRERIDFLLHTAMCKLCRYYARDMKILHKMMQKIANTESTLLPESTKLSKQSCDRIKQALDKALHATETTNS